MRRCEHKEEQPWPVEQDRRSIVQFGPIELTFLAMMGVGTFGSFILQLGEVAGWWWW
jgi:hypothetical protein